MSPIFNRSRPREPSRAAVADGERIYAIGDIHGRIDLLDRLLEKILKDESSREDGRIPRIIGLGDYIDRGDNSLAVLKRIRELDAHFTRAEFLMGNHEDALLGFLDDPIACKSWIEMGGLQTLASLGVPLPNSRPEERDLLALCGELLEAVRPFLSFLRDMPMIGESGPLILTHAGVNPARPLQRQGKRALLWGHCDGMVDEPVRGRCVIHGHYDNPDIVNRPGRICIDTGAYYSGVLTSARIDTEVTFLQT